MTQQSIDTRRKSLGQSVNDPILLHHTRLAWHVGTERHSQ